MLKKHHIASLQVDSSEDYNMKFSMIKYLIDLTESQFRKLILLVQLRTQDMARKREISPILDASDTAPHTLEENNYIPETQPGIQDLLRRLDSQKTSQILDLGDLFTGDEGAAVIAQFIAQNKHITQIELKGNHLTAQGFALICESLKACPNIQSIQAEWNAIGSSNLGLESLLDLVKTSYSLASIDLRNNHIKPDAGDLLAAIVRESHALEVIDLRWNDLGSKGASPILQALREHNRKIRVELSGNKVGEDILGSIREATRTSTKQSMSNDNICYSLSPSKQNDTFLTLRSDEYVSPRTVVTNDLKGSTYLSQHQTIPVTKEYYLPTRRVGTDSNFQNSQKKSLYKSQSYENTNLHHRVGDISTINDTKYSDKTQELSPPRAKREISQSFYVTADPKFYSNYKNYTEKKLNKPNSARTFSESKPLARSQVPDFLEPKDPHIHWSPPKLGSSNTLRELERVRSIYQQEVEEITQKYQTQLDAHLSLTKSLQVETRRADQLESDYQEAMKTLEHEKKYREELENNCFEMERHLKQKELLCSDLGLRNGMLFQEIQHLRTDNERLNTELKKVHEQSSARLKATEGEYQRQISDLTVQLEGMRREFERMAQLHASETRNSNREWELKHRKLKDQLKETERAREKEERQVQILNERILIIQQAHQESLQQLEERLKNEQNQEVQRVTKAAETAIGRIGEERDEANRKFENAIREFQNFENKMNENKAALQTEGTRLKNEIQELRNLVGKANEERDNWMRIVQDRDSTIEGMERDIGNLKRELAWARDNQRREQDRFEQEINSERKRMNELIQETESKNHELERQLRSAEEETRLMKQEHERVKEILEGNISNFIAQTFSEQHTKSFQRPMY